MNRNGTEKGGRPPYDAVLMFKIIVLQKLYN
ncbi:transposase, partial [Leptospira weilii]